MYDRPATTATFNTVAGYDSQFTLHQTGKVPAKGSTRFRFAYAQGFMAAGVAKLATSAVHAFTSCVVPKVTGKPLASAKKAMTHGACAVGKIRYASSSSVKKGRVISQQPKARKKLAYHAKVSLVVSKG